MEGRKWLVLISFIAVTNAWAIQPKGQLLLWFLSDQASLYRTTESVPAKEMNWGLLLEVCEVPGKGFKANNIPVGSNFRSHKKDRLVWVMLPLVYRVSWGSWKSCKKETSAKVQRRYVYRMPAFKADIKFIREDMITLTEIGLSILDICFISYITERYPSLFFM